MMLLSLSSEQNHVGEKRLSMNCLCGGLLSFLVTVFHIVRIQALDLILPELDPFQLVSYNEANGE